MKAVLVMEMQGNCLECPLLNGSDECVVQDEECLPAGADTRTEAECLQPWICGRLECLPGCNRRSRK